MITTLLLLCAAPAAALADAPVPPPTPPPDKRASPALLELRRELSRTELAAARTQPRFRPLCDDRGYPLVGNVASKGTQTRPSEYCADVRTRLTPRTVREA